MILLILLIVLGVLVCFALGYGCCMTIGERNIPGVQSEPLPGKSEPLPGKSEPLPGKSEPEPQILGNPEQMATVQGRGAHNIKHGAGYLLRIEPTAGDIVCFDDRGATGKQIPMEETPLERGLTLHVNDDQQYTVYYS